MTDNAVTADQLSAWFMSLPRYNKTSTKIKEELIKKLDSERESLALEGKINETVFLNWRIERTKIPDWALPILDSYIKKYKVANV